MEFLFVGVVVEGAPTTGFLCAELPLPEPRELRLASELLLVLLFVESLPRLDIDGIELRGI